MIRRSALAAALAIVAPAAFAGGLPEDLPSPIVVPSPPIIVQSADALSPSAATAYGRYSASSGDVDPGVVTIMPENFWVPDVAVEVGQNRRHRRPYRRVYDARRR